MRHKSLLFLLTLVFFASSSFATHLRCGQILIKQSSAGSKTVLITIQVFTNTVNTNVLFGGEDDYLDFGDGTRMLVPETENTVRLDLSPDGSVAWVEFSIEHTYAALGSYTISYSEPNRNAGTLNYDGAVNTRFYLESKFLLMADRAYQSPVSLLPPIFKGFIKDDFSASLAALDSNNFALLYSLEIPLMNKNSRVLNYQIPASANLNPFTGLLTWDCTFNGQDVTGEFLFALKIRQYDTSEEPWKEIGHVYRDFQVIVSQSDTPRGRLNDNVEEENIIEVGENMSRSLKVFAYHHAGEQTEFALVTELPDDFYSFESYDSLHEDQNILVGKLVVTDDPSLKRVPPYVVSIRTSFMVSANDKYFKDAAYAFATSDFIPNIAPVTGIEEQRTLISLSPNPFQDFIRIDNSTDVPVTLCVFNSVGQLVAIVKQDAEKIFRLPTLPSGIYLMRRMVANGKVLSTSRMIKE